MVVHIYSSLQGALNRSYTHLWWQNRLSQKFGGACKYRMDDGCGCAIAPFFPEDVLTSGRFEGHNVERLSAIGHLEIDEDEHFFQELQLIHDAYDDKCGPFRLHLNTQFAALAGKYNLHFNPLDPEVHQNLL